MIDLKSIKDTTIGPETIISEISKTEETHQVSISHLIDLTDIIRENLNELGYSQKIRIDISNNAIDHMLSAYSDNFEMMSNSIIVIKNRLLDYGNEENSISQEIAEYLVNNT